MKFNRVLTILLMIMGLVMSACVVKSYADGYDGWWHFILYTIISFFMAFTVHQEGRENE